MRFCHEQLIAKLTHNALPLSIFSQWLFPPQCFPKCCLGLILPAAIRQCNISLSFSHHAVPPGDSLARVTTALSHLFAESKHILLSYSICMLYPLVKYLNLYRRLVLQSVGCWVQYSLCVHSVTSRATGDCECSLFVPLYVWDLLWNFSPCFFKPRTSARKWE